LLVLALNDNLSIVGGVVGVIHDFLLSLCLFLFVEAPLVKLLKEVEDGAGDCKYEPGVVAPSVSYSASITLSRGPPITEGHDEWLFFGGDASLT
jgi:hypothetical protein